MKKHNGKRTKGELQSVNRLSALMHGGLGKIRLSLTFRIAAHYCIQLLRSLIPVLIIATIIFSVAVSFPISREIQELYLTNIKSNSESVTTNGMITLSLTEKTPEKGLPRRIVQQCKVIFSGELNNRFLCFLYTGENQLDYHIRIDINDILRLWSYSLLAVLVSDVFRCIYFFIHESRLNKRVLAPIRDIASMAATLSENNLSNRINIAGTKNELKDLAIVINSMLDRIELSYNSQKQFVSDASHELRTPIAVIRGYTDMLKRWGKDDPDVLNEGITAISQETDGMKDLVENLLFLARHDKKTLMMEKTIFDPCEILSEIQKEATMVTPEDHFVFSQHEPVLISADRNMIKQVMRILCDNAVKYSARGSTITMSVRNGMDGYCYLSMDDQGDGIPEDDISKIFDRFYRGDKARKTENGGHGLGLSIARIIVVAHEGKIRVRSKSGEGTSFIVILPITEKNVTQTDITTKEESDTKI